jgi:DnaJ domain
MADPYATLGVSPNVSEAELRAAYRRAVQRHHPDHNGGSVESARRFEAVQEAWMEIRRRRAGAPPPPPGTGAPRTNPDPDLDARLASIEDEVRRARKLRQDAEHRAREAAAQASADGRERPSDEELGYIRTDDSVGRILSDAAEGLLGALRDKSAAERAADALDELSSMLRGERKPPGGPKD